MILGMKWFREYDPATNWRKGILTITQEGKPPVVIRGEAGIPFVPLISHVQAKRELRRGAQASVIYINPKHSNLGIPDRYKHIFSKYEHLFLQDDLPPTLPPERPEDHRIDLVEGAQPVSKAPYSSIKPKRPS